MRQCLTLAAILLAALVSATASAEEWPAWRGPRGDGTSLETDVPLKWSVTENVLWKTPIPGNGHSSPIVWGDRVYVTTCQEEKQTRELLCLDAATGKMLWQKVVLTAPLEKKNNLNSCASGTPATDGKRIWVTFFEKPKVWVVCYDADGKELWRRSPGEFYSVHGYCSSLLLYKDMLILNADQDAVAYIVALDQATGAERWRIDRPNRTRSYVPPVVFDAAGKKQMVLAGSKCVASYDPDTGKQHWIIDGPTEQFVASAVFSDGMFFITGGFPSLHLIGVRPDGEGNVTNTHVVWHERKSPSYVPSPIAAGKNFFVVSDAGTASCLEARTGKYLWQQALGRHHSASPVSAAGRLYFLDDEGQMFVIKAAEAYELLAKNVLGEDCRASPAISRGRLFIRGVENLYCIGAATRQAAEPPSTAQPPASIANRPYRVTDPVHPAAYTEAQKSAQRDAGRDIVKQINAVLAAGELQAYLKKAGGQEREHGLMGEVGDESLMQAVEDATALPDAGGRPDPLAPAPPPLAARALGHVPVMGTSGISACLIVRVGHFSGRTAPPQSEQRSRR